MNVVIGRIYQAPWGRYVGHRVGVLRSLDNPNAFSVQSNPDDFIDTGEDHAPQAHRAGVETDPRDPASVQERPAHPPQRAASVRACDGRGSEAVQIDGPGGVQQDASVRGVEAPILTLGGLRPGSVYCIVPGRPQLEWKSCLTRDDEHKGSHVSFLASTDDQSLYCPPCRARRPRVFVGAKAIVAYVNQLLAAGKVQEANDIVDGRRSPKVDNIDEPEEPLMCCPRFSWGDRTHDLSCKHFDSPQTGRLGHSPGSSTVVASVTAGETAPSGVQRRDWCCPRVTLGRGLHSPTCKNFVDGDGERGRGQPAPHETQQGADTTGQRESAAAGAVADPHPTPTDHRGAGPSPSTPIPRDDPKAEVGSFESVMPWRPKYRDYADWDEWRRERAAIFEYLGGHNRKAAEFAANKLAGPPP